METAQTGIIGGSGLYKIEGMRNAREVNIDTPFGPPSDRFVLGELGGKTAAFLPRHGSAHTILPGELNYRANIFAFKKLGVERIISIAAVGSLKENIAPLDIVIPHQFFDRTSKRQDTFFGNGIAAHITFAHPLCMDLADILRNSAEKTGAKVHWGGTYLNMEGPAFSTKSESEVYRMWGMDIIGMTNMAEAKLAREAEICYAVLAFVTDYDCWHPEHESVTVDMIVQNLTKNASSAKEILKNAVPAMVSSRSCKCKDALKDAIITDKSHIPEDVKRRLAPVIDRYIT